MKCLGSYFNYKFKACVTNLFFFFLHKVSGFKEPFKDITTNMLSRPFLLCCSQGSGTQNGQSK